MTNIKVATFNARHKSGPHRKDFTRLDCLGVDIIVSQENADVDDWSPDGWRRFRPRRAQSNTIYYNQAKVILKKGGAKRMSSPGFRSYRDLVWAHFRIKGDNKPIRVGGVHLPAFKYLPKSGIEFKKQERKAARWLSNGTNRVLGGDFNAQVPRRPWTANLKKVGDWSKRVPTGPHGQPIDYIGVPRDGRWRVVSTQMIEATNADHNAVIVELEWK